MKKLVTGALLATAFTLAACGDNTANDPAADTATDTTYGTGAVGETGATMTSPTDTTGAAGAGADTGAAGGGMVDPATTPTATPTGDAATGADTTGAGAGATPAP